MKEIQCGWIRYPMGRMTNGIIIPIERQTGEWIKITNDGTMPVEYICSICGRKIFDNSAHILPINEFYPFCHCGAKMKRKEQKND